MVAPSVRVPDTLGQTLHQLSLARGLVERGVAVTLLCRCGHARDHHGVRLEPVRDAWLPGERLLFTIEAYRRTRQLLAEGDYTMVHDRGYLFAGAGVAAARAAEVPSVLQIDDHWERSERAASRLARTWLHRRLARASCRWQLALATRGFAVSATLRRQAAAWHPDARAKLVAIPNGYDPELFRPDAVPLGVRQRFDIQGPLVVFVGALGPWHGLTELAAVARALPDVAVMVAGGGYQQGLPELPNLHTLGRLPRAQVPRLLAEADLALAPYPPRDFGFSPLKIYEYMGCRVPVVATAVPSVREAVAGRALLTPPGRMAEGVRRLLAQPGLRRRLAAAGYRFASRQRTWASTVEATLVLYSEVA